MLAKTKALLIDDGVPHELRGLSFDACTLNKDFTMFKSIYLAKRNPALSADAFPSRWQQHSALTGTTQRIRPYFSQVIQCARADFSVPVEATTEYDGANLLGLFDQAGGYGVFDEPEAREILLPDELQTFSRPVRECTLVTREEILRDGPFRRFLVLRFLKGLQGVSAEALANHWREAHHALEFEGPGGEFVLRAVANVVVEPTPEGFDFDLVTETWFGREEDLRAYYADVARSEKIAADRSRWCDDRATVTFAAKVNHARPPIEE